MRVASAGSSLDPAFEAGAWADDGGTFGAGGRATPDMSVFGPVE
jgi:hypothetical protein